MPPKKTPSKVDTKKKAQPTQASLPMDGTDLKGRMTSHERAGLIFPVGRILRIMKSGRLAERVSDKSAVAIAAVLEYLSAEIIELAGDQAKEERSMKKYMIKPRHITLAIRGDEELNEVVGGHVIIPMGGVIPHIEPEVDMKGKKSKKKDGMEESGEEDHDEGSESDE